MSARRKKTAKDTLSKIFALPLEVKAPMDNPTTPEKVALGKLLYFDPILSGSKDILDFGRKDVQNKKGKTVCRFVV